MQEMRKIGVFLLLVIGLTVSYFILSNTRGNRPENTILSVVMHLNAMGVESDTYPSITATLDFNQHTGRCERSYFNPVYPSAAYHLSAEELDSVQLVLQQADLGKLKDTYKIARTDQPTSTIIIRTVNRTFIIKDYGLEGEAPLPVLYRLVYKFEY